MNVKPTLSLAVYSGLKPDQVLAWGAEKGCTNICHFAVGWGAKDFNKMMYYAAKGSHRRLWLLAMKWGASKYEMIIAGAIHSQRVQTCYDVFNDLNVDQKETAIQNLQNHDRVLIDIGMSGKLRMCDFVLDNMPRLGLPILLGALQGSQMDVLELIGYDDSYIWSEIDRESLLNDYNFGNDVWIHIKEMIGLDVEDMNSLLRNAANANQEDLCRLVKEWGANDWNSMLKSAAESGHKEMCQLAKEWGATDWGDMLLEATRYGYEEICRLAKEWGADNWNEMLIIAAKYGSENMCRLAKEYGADDWLEMAKHAVENERRNICALAVEWSPLVNNHMLRLAAIDGLENMCHLAKELGADDWNGMLKNATISNKENIIHLAKDWGADDWNGMLHTSIQNLSKDDIFKITYYWDDFTEDASPDILKAMKLCQIAKEYGATNWNDVFDTNY